MCVMSDSPRPSSSRESGRPDPEELLTRYGLREPYQPSESAEAETRREHAKQRGRLRIYLASAAGSGKTFTMLQEGHRREARGTDVVIGYVETHGRPQTIAQI